MNECVVTKKSSCVPDKAHLNCPGGYTIVGPTNDCKMLDGSNAGGIQTQCARSCTLGEFCKGDALIKHELCENIRRKTCAAIPDNALEETVLPKNITLVDYCVGSSLTEEKICANRRKEICAKIQAGAGSSSGGSGSSSSGIDSSSSSSNGIDSSSGGSGSSSSGIDSSSSSSNGIDSSSGGITSIISPTAWIFLFIFIFITLFIFIAKTTNSQISRRSTY